jgi:hypothetical protein
MLGAIRQGSVGQLLGSVPAAQRGAVALALRSSFAAALNELLYITAGVAIVGAVCATVLIRRKDFYRPGEGSQPTAGHTVTQETV